MFVHDEMLQNQINYTNNCPLIVLHESVFPNYVITHLRDHIAQQVPGPDYIVVASPQDNLIQYFDPNHSVQTIRFALP